MRHFLRLDLGWMSFGVLAGMGVCVAIGPHTMHAQTPMTVEILPGSHWLLEHASEPGYLGVEIVDVDADKAQTLRLKDAHGALITLVDHDAPAGQIGLRVNDVVMGLNGQPVASADDLRKLIKEIPPGRKVSIEICRDGNIQTLAVALADRKAMEQAIWGKIGNSGEATGATPRMSMLAGGGNSATPQGFHMPFFAGSLKVGAMVEPLTSQMAAYLGVQSGLMVKQVEHKSEAETAGLRAFDVILKVGPDAIATSADWDRALRANAGKPVQVTILRDKKQQMLTLQVDSKRRSAVEYQDLFGDGGTSLMAELEEELAPEFAEFSTDAQAEADAGSRQFHEFLQSFSSDEFKIDPKQMDELREQLDQLKDKMREWSAREDGCAV